MPGADQSGLYPALTRSGIQVMSINLLLDNDTDPVLWRGPVIAGAVKQFWTDVIWENVDYLFVDMPPGTGDVPLTVFQSIPVDGGGGGDQPSGFGFDDCEQSGEDGQHDACAGFRLCGELQLFHLPLTVANSWRFWRERPGCCSSQL